MKIDIVSFTHLLISVLAIIILLDIWFYYWRREARSGDKENMDWALIFFSSALGLWALQDLFILIIRNSSSPSSPLERFIGTTASTLNNGAFLLSFCYFQHAPDAFKGPGNRTRFRSIVIPLTILINLLLWCLIIFEYYFAAALIDAIYTGITLSILGGLLVTTFWRRDFFGIGLIGPIVIYLAIYGQVSNNDDLNLNNGTSWATILLDGRPVPLPVTDNEIIIQDVSSLGLMVSYGSSLLSPNVISVSGLQMQVQQGDVSMSTQLASSVQVYINAGAPANTITFLSPSSLKIKIKHGDTLGHVFYLVSYFAIICLFIALAFSWILEKSDMGNYAFEDVAAIVVADSDPKELKDKCQWLLENDIINVLIEILGQKGGSQVDRIKQISENYYTALRQKRFNLITSKDFKKRIEDIKDVLKVYVELM